jgi:hypothetical protein
LNEDTVSLIINAEVTSSNDPLEYYGYGDFQRFLPGPGIGSHYQPGTSDGADPTVTRTDSPVPFPDYRGNVWGPYNSPGDRFQKLGVRDCLQDLYLNGDTRNIFGTSIIKPWVNVECIPTDNSFGINLSALIPLTFENHNQVTNPNILNAMRMVSNGYGALDVTALGGSSTFTRIFQNAGGQAPDEKGIPIDGYSATGGGGAWVDSGVIDPDGIDNDEIAAGPSFSPDGVTTNSKQTIDATTSGATPSLGVVNLATAAVLPNTPVYASPAETISNTTGIVQLVIDTIDVSVGDRILVKDQTTNTQNGIYDVTADGTVGNWVLTRSSDFNQAAMPLSSGSSVYVETRLGASNSGTTWTLQNTINDVDPLTDAVVFIQGTAPINRRVAWYDLGVNNGAFLQQIDHYKNWAITELPDTNLIVTIFQAERDQRVQFMNQEHTSCILSCPIRLNLGTTSGTQQYVESIQTLLASASEYWEKRYLAPLQSLYKLNIKFTTFEGSEIPLEKMLQPRRAITILNVLNEVFQNQTTVDNILDVRRNARSSLSDSVDPRLVGRDKRNLSMIFKVQTYEYESPGLYTGIIKDMLEADNDKREDTDPFTVRASNYGDYK